MNNPIVQRELISSLRMRKSLALQMIPAALFALLVLFRWPTDARVGLSGNEAMEVFRVFAYGLLTTLLVLVPAFPATSLVREKLSGTLSLLLNSPMNSWSIYFGKLLGVLGFAFLPLAASLPAAAACYAMGGISLSKDLALLYGILALVTVQYAALALWVSCRANTTDGALRLTYGLVLLVSVGAILPYQFLQGDPASTIAWIASGLRCLSPIPAVMEIVGHGDVASQGFIAAAGVPATYAILAVITTLALAVHTTLQLTPTMFDKSRDQGVITDDRSGGQQWFRRMAFLIDPQRRQQGIGPLTNPVMVKEFRSRRFGRLHWMLRLVALCAILSLLFTLATVTGTIGWGVETIGGIMVALQVALIFLFSPSLGAGLISAEHENGGWTLLRLTPLSGISIVIGKLLSILWPLFLLLLATVPGYMVMIYIKPVMTQQILYVLACLLLASALALLLSATVSSFFRRTAAATVTAYALLGLLFGGTMLAWLAEGAPLGRKVVENILVVNPMAAALNVLQVRGFENYDLLPLHWWIMAGGCLLCVVVLSWQTRQLTKPQ